MTRVEQMQQLYTMVCSENVDYYEVLGLNRECTDRDIKKAYRKLSMICHPDNFVSESEEIQAMADDCSYRINQMNDTLSDPLRRSHYDKHGKELDQKDIELAKKEKQEKEFIDAIFNKLPTEMRHPDELLKQTIHPKLIYHGGKHTFEYDGKKYTLIIPKGTLPMSTFTLKHVLGEGLPESLKGDLIVLCVYGSSKNCDIEKLNVTVSVSENDIKYNEDNLPIKVKVLGSWVDVSKAKISKSKKGNTYKIEALGLQNALFTVRGDLIVNVA